MKRVWDDGRKRNWGWAGTINQRGSESIRPSPVPPSALRRFFIRWMESRGGSRRNRISQIWERNEVTLPCLHFTGILGCSHTLVVLGLPDRIAVLINQKRLLLLSLLCRWTAAISLSKYVQNFRSTGPQNQFSKLPSLTQIQSGSFFSQRELNPCLSESVTP